MADGRIQVTLSDQDYIAAKEMGTRRYEESQQQRLAGRRGCNPNLPQDIRGAAAEIAFARAIGVAPDLGINTYHAPDIAGLQVRSTERANGRLIHRPEDPIDDEYVLLTGTDKQWVVVGLTQGRLARQDRFWYNGDNGRPGCWMVPQNELKRINLTTLRQRANAQ